VCVLRECPQHAIYFSKSVLSQCKRSKFYPPLRRRRLETQQNITMSPSWGRSQFLGEFFAVLQRGRLEIWGLMQPAHQLKPFSRHRPSELCSSHGALYASYYFILYLRIYKYIECSGLWAGSHQKPRRRRSVCTGRACTKIERRVVCSACHIYFILRSLRQIELNGAFWHTFRPLVFSSWL
jgi:hypothetical protein